MKGLQPAVAGPVHIVHQVHRNHLQSRMIGALLATAGGKVEDDMQMLRDLDLEILQVD